MEEIINSLKGITWPAAIAVSVIALSVAAVLITFINKN